MNNSVSRQDRAVPFLVKIGTIGRGRIQTIHIQTEGQRSLCGKALPNYRLVSATEFRGQMMVCAACERRS